MVNVFSDEEAFRDEFPGYPNCVGRIDSAKRPLFLSEGCGKVAANIVPTIMQRLVKRAGNMIYAGRESTNSAQALATWERGY
jgi:hypothetical protein